MKIFITSNEENVEKFIKSGNKRPKHIMFINDYKDKSQLEKYKNLECYAYDLEARDFIDSVCEVKTK